MNSRTSRWLEVIVASVLLLSQGTSAQLQIRCQAAKSKFCANFAFPLVAIPNYRGGTVMTEIDQEIATFLPSYTSGCSNALVHFLCAYYNPACFNLSDELALRIPPCRELCHYVRSSCEPVMNQTGLTWPHHLDCSQFPSTCTTTTCYPGHATLDLYQNLPSLSVPLSFVHPVNITKGTDLGRKAVIILFDCVSITPTEGQILQCHLVVTSAFEVDKTVQITAVGDTASSGSDFDLLTTSVTIKAFTMRSDPIRVMIVNDTIVEDEEMFQLGVVLSDELLSCGVELGRSSTVNVTIEDDDIIICSKSAENVSVTEGEAVNITINCSGYFDFDFTLFLNTTAGSAQDGVDFVSNTYSLVFSAGQQSLSLVINTIDDEDCEQDEFFKLVIVGSDMPSKVQIGSDDCYVIIKDNDSNPSNQNYPECSRRHCRKNPAQSICRVPATSDDSTSTGCTGQFDLSTCGACYYSTTVRNHPEDCRYQCPGRVDEEYLKVYGSCVKEKYLEEYGRPSKEIKKSINFKCFQPVC